MNLNYFHSIMACVPRTENNRYATDFKEIEELGRGSIGRVKKVIHGETGNYFAIKIMKFDLKEKEKFEKKCLSSILALEFNHDRLIKYHDVWLEENSSSPHKNILFIQMEYCECTLEDILIKINDPSLKDNNLLNEEGLKIVSGIFKQILEGVNYLYKREKPVMHRDLNLRNILLKKRQLLNGYEVKIADFDLSKVYYINEPNTQDQGTVTFMAPEVKDGTKYDIKADIYSLGVILEKLLQINMDEYVYYYFQMQSNF